MSFIFEDFVAEVYKLSQDDVFDETSVLTMDFSWVFGGFLTNLQDLDKMLMRGNAFNKYLLS
jgi:hypothetical protein